ncbi:hypothetical protein PLICRDRAFT_322835 [Plicaturopsis crispa FD-325 SS-3]|nr:hypothetical protein PLICRDRAFT_322835 [Plicaturopsis crispa FD-325 SS-3]
MSNSESSLPPKSGAFQWTQSPNPEWKPGDGLGDTPAAKKWREDEEQGWKEFRPQDMELRSLHRLMTSGIAPRPVSFVSTLSADGVPNLAPFSWFQMITHRPPMIMFSAGRWNGPVKDTVTNIKATNEFTVNLISEPWIEAANFASVEAPPDVSEWIGSGLRMEPSTIVKPPRVRESAFSMECEIYKIVEIPDPVDPDFIRMNVVFGLVKLIHVRNAVLKPDDTLDVGLFKPIARLGSSTYATLGEAFTIVSPKWDAVKDDVESLEKQASGP